jgi:DNA polymerase-4
MVLFLFLPCYRWIMSMRKIIHVDMDAFYASVEQRDNPELRGRPLAVGHGAKRGVVAAASYEARRFGVHSAMPATTALRQCPELLFVPPRFDIYRAVSQQIHAIFAEYTALIEPLSLDEAYLDVTENQRGLPTASATAKEIRAAILRETGLTASAGVSYNKFLAKLASAQRKPNGQFVIPPETGATFIASLPVAKFHGIGPVTASRMQRLGIETGADLRARSLAFMQRHFGKAAAWYVGIANGEDNRPVVADRPRKSSGSETTFDRDLTADADIENGVKAMVEEVWDWCKKSQAFGRTVTVKVKFADFQQVTRSRSFQTTMTSYEVLCQASIELVRTLLPTAKGVRLLGVTVSNFGQPVADTLASLPLFEACGAMASQMAGLR